MSHRDKRPPTMSAAAAMISSVVPPTVATVHTRAPAARHQLLAAEADALGRAAPRRIAEFAAGRHCARAALAQLGFPCAPLLRGPDREPRWPDGAVGSITHCAGYCAAAVARADTITTVGIDAEPHGPLPAGVLERIALPTELSWIRADRGSAVCWDRLLFCAKEAVFKAWYPLTRLWLEFEGAEIAFAPPASTAVPARTPSGTPASAARTSGTFEARLRVAPPHVDGAPLRGFHGRYLVSDGLAVTAIAVARGAPGNPGAAE